MFWGARCEAALAPARASARQHEDMEREARHHAAGGRSPGCFENALHFHGCHQATTSIGRDKFDLQILNARLREIDDAQNSLVVQAGRRRPGTARAVPRAGRPGSPPRARAIRLQGSFDRPGSRDSPPGAPLLPAARGWGTPWARCSGSAAIPRPAPARIGGGSRDVDVIALHEEGDDDHKDDQQHEHHVDERRDVDFGLQTGAGTVCC